MNNIHKKTPQELIKFAENMANKNEELQKDIQAIVRAVLELSTKVDLTKKINFMWIVSNYKVIIAFIIEVLAILKTKGHINEPVR